MKANLKEYQLILEYIKKFGTRDFEKLLRYYTFSYENIDKEKLIQRELLEDFILKKIIENNQKLINFLKKNNLKISLFNENFFKFIGEIKNNLSLISVYLENIDQLLNLGIEQATIYDDKNCFCFIIKNDQELTNSHKINGKWIYVKEPIPLKIRKIYTDGIISFSDKNVFGEGTINCPYFIFGGFHNYYYANVLNNNWVIDINHEKQKRTINLHLKNSFKFDPRILPNKEELDSFEIPEALTKFHKELILKKSK